MLRAIGHALLLIIFALPIALIVLYLWRHHANKTAPVATKATPGVSGASFGGPAGVAKTRAETSSAGAMVTKVADAIGAHNVDHSEPATDADYNAQRAAIAERNAAAVADVARWDARAAADASAIRKGSNDSNWLMYYNFAVSTGAMLQTDAAAATLAELKASVAGKTTPEGIRFDSAGNSLGMAGHT